MGSYLETSVLREDYVYDLILREAMRDASREIMAESAETPRHDERVEMATRVASSDPGAPDPVAASFLRALKERVARDDAVRSAAFSGGVASPDGSPVPEAWRINDADLLWAVIGAWDDAMSVAQQVERAP